ncbi:Presequence translocated-associated motor subunit pam17 [Penicillium pulvis]|uniref:Presequence translocated-associated motor subunit pam17 n=1 Tax=Penicillium pulvis TaxID=1562058 RepID=UPI0025472B5B|nr:Presequence translocated-associated motor subunit pam17 [Penicillium pulvis]KAJ5793339.1 Presequence translocated-associated motor subunit pam17 [Penicillium pulvis]
MSARTVIGGRLGTSALSSLATPSPRITSQQLARLHSTVVRPSPGVASKLSIKQNARPTPTVSSRPGLRMNSTSSAGKDEVKLDWDSFFKLRASRRRYSLASSVATCLVSTTAGVQILSSQDLESLGAQVMGLDPFVVLGMATAACGAAGWLLGPIVGNGLWGLVYRRFTPSVATKEKEFFDRIRRFRVDPSTNSIANPVPDYYGEKIGSVQGYRQWLKDQRAYNRKRRNFIA